MHLASPTGPTHMAVSPGIMKESFSATSRPSFQQAGWRAKPREDDNLRSRKKKP